MFLCLSIQPVCLKIGPGQIVMWKLFPIASITEGRELFIVWSRVKNIMLCSTTDILYVPKIHSLYCCAVPTIYFIRIILQQEQFSLPWFPGQRRIKGDVRDTPLSIQILSLSCKFRQKFDQIISWCAPLCGWCPHGKS